MKNKYLLTFFTILAYGITAFSQSIVGTVKGEETGKGLVGANISILNTSKGASTDLDGKYEIKHVHSGNYIVKASYVGFKSITKNVTIKENEDITLNFVLEQLDDVLEEVTVKGQSFKLKNSASTVNVISTKNIKNITSAEQPLRLLEQVPGINVVAYGQGGIADQFSIRGFNGGHAGGAGMQIDGVSLNEAEGHGEGYADMGILIPLNLSKIKVYKGPSSALFGRYAMGGTVALETRKTGDYKDVSIKGGSFATLDAQYAQGTSFKVGRNDRRIQVNFAFQALKTDGYIKNANITKGNVDGRISFPLSDKSKIALSFRGHKSKFGAPGYMTRAQFEDKKMRRFPDQYAENDGGGKNFFSERIDYSYKINDNVTLLLFGYAVQQDFTRFAKFSFGSWGGQSERGNTRRVLSLGGSVNGNTQLGKKDFDWIAGIELNGERTSRKRYHTSFRVRQGDPYLEDVSIIETGSAFAQGELKVHDLFKPTIGLRFDAFGGTYHVIKDEKGGPEKIYSINDLSHFSPKLGFRSTFAKGLDFRVNVSNGFYLTTGDEVKAKYTQSDLKPAQLWQYEAGLSYENQWLSADVAGYILNSSQEVRKLPDGSYVNQGKTRRSGVEANVKVTPTEGLYFNGTFAFSDTEILNGPDKGAELAQIPDAIFTIEGNYTSPIGLGVNVNFRHVSDYFVGVENDSNGKPYNYYAGGYNLTNLTLFYNFNKLSSNKGRVYVTVNNLFNEYYAETYYARDTFISPSPTCNFSVGVNYSF
ncbi:MAG: TonB-dependent receptor [Tenacibaculum sp.]|nr:TonB-dependent receptor [Tenacibaculum sp.]